MDGALLSLLVTLDLAFWLLVCFLSRRLMSFDHITVCLGVVSLGGFQGYWRFFSDLVIGIPPSLLSLVFERTCEHSSSLHLPILQQAVTLTPPVLKHTSHHLHHSPPAPPFSSSLPPSSSLLRHQQHFHLHP